MTKATEISVKVAPRQQAARKKGAQFERQMAAILRQKIWPGCYPSRVFGCATDDYNGIDLLGTGIYNVQLKAVERSLNYHKILSNMPKAKKINIVIHKRFEAGAIVAMTFDDFVTLVKWQK